MPKFDRMLARHKREVAERFKSYSDIKKYVEEEAARKGISNPRYIKERIRRFREAYKAVKRRRWRPEPRDAMPSQEEYHPPKVPPSSAVPSPPAQQALGPAVSERPALPLRRCRCMTKPCCCGAAQRRAKATKLLARERARLTGAGLPTDVQRPPTKRPRKPRVKRAPR